MSFFFFFFLLFPQKQPKLSTPAYGRQPYRTECKRKSKKSSLSLPLMPVGVGHTAYAAAGTTPWRPVQQIPQRRQHMPLASGWLPRIICLVVFFLC